MAWHSIESAPKDGSQFLVWEVVICDEEDEEGNVIARNQRVERPVVVQWVDMFGIFAEPRGHACPSNGTWNLWQPIEAPAQVKR